MSTWARFCKLPGKEWMFRGFTGFEEKVVEFEEIIAEAGGVSICLDLDDWHSEMPDLVVAGTITGRMQGVNCVTEVEPPEEAGNESEKHRA